MKAETFADIVRQGEVDVPVAALLLAREIAYPGLDTAPYLAQLDELAAGARAFLPPEPSMERGAALALYLAGRAGFEGNVIAYDDPRNSFLNDVLVRRTGIPITLSIIYVAVARRLGLEAYGIGLPGHFITGIATGGERVLIDLFHGGATLSAADCARLVQETTGYEGPLDPQWLEPAPPISILARLLNNLRLGYIQRAEWAQATAVLSRLHQLQPGEAAHLRDLGLIHYQQGEFYAAARYLERYLQEEPGTAEATAIRENLSNDFARWARLN